MTQRVRAVVFDEPGPADVLHLGSMQASPLSERDVRVRVHGAGINRAEVLERLGKYPVPPGASPILGLEATGRITEVGKAVTKWTGGERVAALLNGGGYSEEVVVREDMLVVIPESWTDAEAAGFMETVLTAFLNIFEVGGMMDQRTHKIKPGSVLVHGGGSGVGTAAIALCKAKQIKILVTAGSKEKCKQCLDLGADHAINYREEKFEEVVLRLTDNKGVDMVLDLNGAPYLQKDISCLATDGRIVFIAMMGGSQVEKLDLAPIMRKRAHVIGSMLRARAQDFKGRIIADLQEVFGEAIADGTLKPIIHKTFPLEQAAQAHKCMEASENFGKIVLLTQYADAK